MYSAFKETNSMILNQEFAEMPMRLTKTGFANFSKVLNSNGDCSNQNLNEEIIPIEKVSIRNKPSKE